MRDVGQPSGDSSRKGFPTKENDFRLRQFDALRQEILGIKNRIIRILVVGIGGIPIVIGAGEKYDIDALLMAGPLITLVFAFMLVFEQGSLMRAGEYIKSEIEPNVCPKGFVGWETWLEGHSSRRIAEAFLAWAARIAFTVYFGIGTYLAFGALVSRFGTCAAVVALGLYCGGFVLALYLFVAYFSVRTSS